MFGIERTTAMHASIISMTLPFMVYFMVGIFLKEKVHGIVIIGSILAAIGVTIVLVSSLKDVGGTSSVLGDSMLLLSMLFGAISLLIVKKSLSKGKVIPSAQLAFIEYTVVALISLSVLIVTVQSLNFNASLLGFFWLGMAVTVAGVVPTLIYYTAIKKLPSERIADTNFITPVVGFLAAAIILGESISLVSALGLIIVFVGLAVSNNKFKPIHASQYIVGLEKQLAGRIKTLEQSVSIKARDFEDKAITTAKSSLL